MGVKAVEWLRFYVGTLDNPKVQGLPGGIFKAWVNCLCLARINDGVLPSVDVIAFRLRCSTRQAEQWRDDLAQRKLVDVMPDGTSYRMHDWDQHQYVSDGSTERVRKHREKQRQAVPGNVSVTPPEQSRYRADTETEEASGSKSPRVVENPPASFPSSLKSENQRLIAEALAPHAEAIGQPVDAKLCDRIIEAAGGDMQSARAAAAFIDKRIRRTYVENVPNIRRKPWPETLGFWIRVVGEDLFKQPGGCRQQPAPAPAAAPLPERYPEPPSKRRGGGLERAGEIPGFAALIEPAA